jgi:hypothetical protein
VVERDFPALHGKQQFVIQNMIPILEGPLTGTGQEVAFDNTGYDCLVVAFPG